MQAQEIFDKLKEQFADAIIELKIDAPSDPFIMVDVAKLFDIAQYMRDKNELNFDYLVDLVALDLGENLGAVYVFYSMNLKHRIALKVIVPKDNPKLPTLENLWRTADWLEREAWDLMGIEFEGHHNLIRILNPYDWEGHPLRKDYVTPEVYHGMKVPY
ncbi:MAG: NADH-quinone oxidoreductase subunit C [bacterium]